MQDKAANQNEREIARKLSAKDIFLDALELADDQRDAFVEEKCADDEALKLEVLQLLTRHRSTQGSILSIDFGRLLATELSTSPDAATAGETKDKADAGKVDGRYQLMEELGRGGFAVVFRGKQTQPLERDVAIKLMSSHSTNRNSNLLKRFQDERQMQSLMNHPNIARLIDAGETNQGQPFLVMEYVDGDHITKYCDDKNATIAQRLRVFVDVCHGIQHAHQKGVIHRDLKPSNIIVSEIDEHPIPKVIDFGVAKIFEGQNQSLDLTERGQLIGSPAYMSPEQAESDIRNIDTRADVYSLGVLLYELLTGKLPLGPDDLSSINSAKMIRLICETEPRPLSQCHRIHDAQATAAAANRGMTLNKLRGYLRSDLNWIVMKCLDRNPDRRYGSVKELLDDVERNLNVEPVMAGPPTFSYRLARFVQRNWVGVVATSLVLLALLLGIIGTSVGMLMALKEKDRAVEARFLAEQIKEINSGMLNDVISEDYNGKFNPVLKNSLDDAAKRLDQQDASSQKSVVAELRYSLGHAYLKAKIYDDARVQLQHGLSSFTRLLGTDHPKCIYGRTMLAASKTYPDAESEADLTEAKLAEAEAELDQAVAQCLAISDPEISEWAIAMQTASTAHLEMRNYDVMESLVRKTLERVSLEPPTDDGLIFDLQQDLALSLARQDRHADAALVNKELLEVQRDVLGERHPRTRQTMGALAANYRNVRRRNEGLALAREVCALDQELQNPNFQRLSTLGQLQCLTGDYYRGLPSLYLALELAPPDRHEFIRGKIKRFEIAAEETQGVIPLTASIGVELAVENGRLVVASIARGGSAEHSNKVLTGDVILQLIDNGRRIKATGISVDEAQSFLRGTTGTDVELELERKEHLVRLTRTPVPSTGFEFPQASIGTTPREVRFTKLDSRNPVRLSDLKNRTVVIYLWASWCGSSQRPIEKIRDIIKDNPQWADTVQFIGASVDDSADLAEIHAQRKEWQTLLHVHLDRKNARRLGAIAVPQLIVVDKEGAIGYSGSILDVEFETLINRLNSR